MAATQNDSDDIITGINVTPLVDIILVLLIIFMLTANIIAKPSIHVQLPKASTGEATEPTTIALTLNKEGDIFLNGAVTDEAALRKYLQELGESDPKTQAIIAADKEVLHGRVIWLIDMVRTAKIYNFAINIDPSVNAPVK
ncbi:MAG: biopolymer transporter ExbD [Deltaproteobacteria bacterium]|nr:biopolymer transporter ExbD [Deltaproteobacteria bacterium]